MQAAAPIFAATLTPRRALSRRGRRLVVAVLTILAGIPGLVFFSLGAWPVIGFLGLDVLAVWWALSASARDGKRREEIRLWADRIEILAVGAGGRQTMTAFAPVHVRLIVARDFDERTTGIRLRDKDRDLEIGGFLNHEDRASFARAFGTALKKARGASPSPAPRPLSGRESNRKS